MSESKDSLSSSPSNSTQELYDLVDLCSKEDHNAMDKLLDIIFLGRINDNIKSLHLKYIETKNDAYTKTLSGFIYLISSDPKKAELIFMHNMHKCIYAYVGMSYIYWQYDRINMSEYAFHALNSGCNFANIVLTNIEYDKKNYDKSLEYAIKATNCGFNYGLYRQAVIYKEQKKYEEALKYYFMAFEHGCVYAKDTLTESTQFMDMVLINYRDNNEKIANLIKKNNDLEESITTKDKRYVELCASHNLLERSFDELKVENNILQEKINRLIKFKTADGNDIAMIDKDVINLKEQNDILKQQIDNLKKHIDELKKEIDGLKEVNRALQSLKE
jgi:FtsZ-binding cell division protein ZapB